jgi:multicomponent Na+:H+ antiporter subunit A
MLGIAIVVPFVAAALAPVCVRRGGRFATAALAAIPSALGVYFLAAAIGAEGTDAVRWSMRWADALGMTFSLRLDGLSAVFAGLVCLAGGGTLVYADGYLAGSPRLGRLQAFLLFFFGAMLGMVLADDLLLFFLFWELTSVASFLLIGFDHERESARKSAWQALLVTGGGGLALLAGLLLLSAVGHGTTWSSLFDAAETVRASAAYPWILGLLCLGAFTKSAQVPFHFWLPSAMEAPTPVSAYLHSATMVKAGVFLLLRAAPVVGGTPAWQGTLILVGAATAVLGAVVALRQSDAKRMLAYSTISTLGLLVLLTGAGTPTTILAAVSFVVAHGLYKGALFQVAGMLDHGAGTRDLAKLSGLRAAMPVSALVAGLAALSMAALPPSFAFLSKELLLESLLEGPSGVFLVIVAVVAGFSFFGVALLVGVGPFFGRRADEATPHEVGPSLWLPPFAFAVLGLALGLFPEILGKHLLAPAAASVLREPVVSQWKLWHGWNAALALSLLTVAGGFASVVGWRKFRWYRPENVLPAAWTASGLYDRSLRAFQRVAEWQTALFQHGRLGGYLGTAVLVAIVLVVGVSLWDGRPASWLASHGPPNGFEVALAVLVVLAAATVVTSSSRLRAVAALGVTGYGVALVFVLFGAPDVAMTQFLIETLTVILLLLVFQRYPDVSVPARDRYRRRDALLAVTAGLVMTLLVGGAVSANPPRPLADFFAARSLPDAHGKNVVNVILVDFRALDTLGEVTVLAVAALGVAALLSGRARREVPR